MSSAYDKFKGIIPDALIDQVREECENANLTGKQVEEVLERTKKAFEDALIAPGESIGVITAESFGEPGTQMTLDVFHLAGVAEVQVTRGLPRLIEIFDARVKPSSPRTTIYLKPKYAKDDNTITKVASFIKQINLEEISTEFTLNIMKGAVEVTLDEVKIKKFGFKIEDLAKSLSEKLKGVEIKELKRGISIQLNETKGNLAELYKLREKSKRTIVRGVSGITQVIPTRKDGKVMIVCAGSNLKELIKMEEVDVKNIKTNDIYEISKVFGIEAARQAIMDEVIDVIQDQGLDIDIRHIMFLADLMTHRGEINGVTRGGITGEKESVLARASFETPINHLVDASIIGERDELRSVIENVIMNQPIPTGTGLPTLVAKTQKKESK